MNSPETLLNSLFGRHCGLNADWSVSAWRVSGTLYAGIYITDDEDGSFSLVRSTFDTDSDCHATETIATVDASLVSALVVIARTNAEIAAKGLLPLCGEQIALLVSTEPQDAQECADMLEDLRARCGLTIDTSDLG